MRSALFGGGHEPDIDAELTKLHALATSSTATQAEYEAHRQQLLAWVAASEATPDKAGESARWHRAMNRADEARRRTHVTTASAVPTTAPQGNQELLSVAIEMEDANLRTLRAAAQKVAEAEDLGGAIAQELAHQGHQIGRVHQKTHTVVEQQKTADRLLTVIMRRVQTDRCLQALVVLIVLVIGAILFMKYGVPALNL